MVKHFLSEKLNKRFLLLQDDDQLRTHIDVNILPKEYGGNQTEDEMVKEFIKLINLKRENVSKIINFKVDINKVPLDKLSVNHIDNVGSFRKLEVE